jgi:Chaperone of endosialidase
MADTKISNLPSATTPLAGTEVVPVVQSGVTKKVAVSSLASPSGTANGVAYFNGSAVFSSGSALTFDGTNLGVGAVATDTNSYGRAVDAIGTNGAAYYARNAGNNTVGFFGAYYGAFNSVNLGSTTNSDIVFYRQNSEQMRLTSTGLGIGTSSPSAKLDIVGNQKITGYIELRSANKIYFDDATNSSSGAIWNNASGTAALSFTGNGSTEHMRLDSSGNLGLGVTPSAWYAGAKAFQFGGNASLLNNATNATFFLHNAYYDTAWRYIVSGQQASYYAQVNSQHQWFTAPSGTAGNAISFTQALTLDNSGNLLVGTTTTSLNNSNSCSFNISGNSYLTVNHINGTVTTTYYSAFGYNGSAIGSITQSGTTAVLYNITSDQRLKENIQNADNASALIDSLQVRKFDWKADGSHQRYGFVAQELVTVAPEAVHQPADPEEMMAVDYSKLVPMLVKEIQSLRKRLAAAGIA